MSEENKKKREDEVEMIYQKILDAIPIGVSFGSIIVALNELAMEFGIEMGNSTDEDYDDEEFDGRNDSMNGSGFSHN
jgi:hypothetical protein